MEVNFVSKMVLIGKRIRQIREQRNLLQKDFALMIGESRRVVSRVENGHQRRHDSEMLDRMAGALSCTREDLEAPLDAPVPRARYRNPRTRTFLVDGGRLAEGSWPMDPIPWSAAEIESE
jgi:transcriptional regulator with XRE-family HTH domain